MATGNGEDRLKDVARSKSALDAAKSYRHYMDLIKDGWPRDKAFAMAFMGVHLLDIPGLKPLPDPDPPFSADSLVAALKVAHKRTADLMQDIEADIAFIQKHPPH